MDSVEQICRAIRSISDALGVRLAYPVFQGCLVGLPILLIARLFEDQLRPYANVQAVPEFAWLALGVSIVFAYRWIAGVRMVPDTTRTGIETLEEVLDRGNLSASDKRQYWRTVAMRISNEVSLKDGLIVDYVSIGDAAVAEEAKANRGGSADANG